jgi:hypothetical protein
MSVSFTILVDSGKSIDGAGGVESGITEISLYGLHNKIT